MRRYGAVNMPIDAVGVRLAGLSEPEQFAACAVERATGAKAAAHDVGGRQGAYDFALTYADGRTGAVEVTSHAGPGRRQLEGVLGKDNFAWPNPGQWAWSTAVADPADLSRFGEVYAHVIALCEGHGAIRPDLLPWEVRYADPDLRWLETSTVSMSGHPSVPAADGDRRRPVYVLPEGGGGVIDEDLVGLDQAVADLLAVPSVTRRVAKVGGAVTDERHLFVSVDTSGLPFPIAGALMGRPARLPSTTELVLPRRLTHLWLAPRYLHVLLGWTVSDGWRAHDVYG